MVPAFPKNECGSGERAEDREAACDEERMVEHAKECRVEKGEIR